MATRENMTLDPHVPFIYFNCSIKMSFPVLSNASFINIVFPMIPKCWCSRKAHAGNSQESDHMSFQVAIHGVIGVCR